MKMARWDRDEGGRVVWLKFVLNSRSTISRYCGCYAKEANCEGKRFTEYSGTFYENLYLYSEEDCIGWIRYHAKTDDIVILTDKQVNLL